MIVTALAGGLSFIVGVAVGGAWVFRQTRKKVNSVEVIDDLTYADHNQVTRDFAAHVHSAQLKVSEYADALADGDDDLRHRLRHFEKGGRL